MAYVKTNWVNDQTRVNADNMNKIEQGIKDAHDAISGFDLKVFQVKFVPGDFSAGALSGVYVAEKVLISDEDVSGYYLLGLAKFTAGNEASSLRGFGFAVNNEETELTLQIEVNCSGGAPQANYYADAVFAPTTDHLEFIPVGWD